MVGGRGLSVAACLCLAAGVDVLYEVSAGDGAWSEIARAPRDDQVFRAIAFVYAEAPSTSELSVTRMEWATCER